MKPERHHRKCDRAIFLTVPAQRVPDERAAPRATVTDVGTQRIRRKPVLDGLINEYAHAA